ncbi:hypothetical protein [Pseudomonas sichuanensis]|uniref:hypothetical protein n=1 Tax=Pseudomonas TaxID=286 RepID=UPI0036EF1380
MEKNIFMIFDEYLSVLDALRKESGLDVYISCGYENPYLLVENISSITSMHYENFRQLDVIIGDGKDFAFEGRPQGSVGRCEKIGFVSAIYGRDDEHAIGLSTFSGDKSGSEGKIDRILTKLLKKKAHKGAVDVAGRVSYITDRYYWTDRALESGKNWLRFFGSGVRKPLNLKPGYRPKDIYQIRS